MTNILDSVVYAVCRSLRIVTYSRVLIGTQSSDSEERVSGSESCRRDVRGVWSPANSCQESVWRVTRPSGELWLQQQSDAADPRGGRGISTTKTPLPYNIHYQDFQGGRLCQEALQQRPLPHIQER
ncbi:hypothetical protein GDO78_016534 [Eleutherodactylus coqui]|uniref:Uncharacterized protein n=1 Tax=Eleutherodactylus coqui TaxID=57060 RepID=A0A8J6EPA1_ELECQ|nr:hypothetical protein GDO78_016534 [Eleutherodactylus coqui]